MIKIFVSYSQKTKYVLTILGSAGTIWGFLNFWMDANPWYYWIKLVLAIILLIIVLIIFGVDLYADQKKIIVCDNFPQKNRLCSVLGGALYGENGESQGSENHELMKLDSYENYFVTSATATTKAQNKLSMTLPKSPYDTIDSPNYDTFIDSLSTALESKVKRKIKLIILSKNEYNIFLTSLARDIIDDSNKLKEYIKAHYGSDSKIDLKWLIDDNKINEFILIDNQVALKYCGEIMMEPLNKKEDSVIYFDFDKKGISDFEGYIKRARTTKKFIDKIKKETIFHDIYCWQKSYKDFTYEDYIKKKTTSIDEINTLIQNNRIELENKLMSIYNSTAI